MLWGASKMFDLFDKENFCIVFDYKCDIEVHLGNSLEFYQVKTHKFSHHIIFQHYPSRVKQINQSLVSYSF